MPEDEQTHRFVRFGKWLGLLLAAFIVAGTIARATGSHWLPLMIVKTPNADRTLTSNDDASPTELAKLGVSRQLRVDVGPPAASLSVWVVEPSASAPHATILGLHGLSDRKTSLLPTARYFAQSGYRTVLVDLRGHGLSSGRWSSYGVVEAADLAQVLDALEREKLVAGKVGVYGTSYGAACGLMLAGHDPRVRAVVSVASFATMREEVPYFIRHWWKCSPCFLRSETITRAIEDAGKLAGFDPKDASPLAAIQRTGAQVLLIHGDPDEKVPVEHSRQLHAAAPLHSDLIVAASDGHDLFFRDRDGIIARATREWFERWL